MIESRCECGVGLAGEDLDALVAEGVRHYGAVHPDMGLTEISVRNYFEAEERYRS